MPGGRRGMLLIDNDIVKRVLTMRECIEAQERAFAGTPTGASVSRPRIDMFVPCNREDGYYRWGSVEGASDGVLAVPELSVAGHRPHSAAALLSYLVLS